MKKLVLLFLCMCSLNGNAAESAGFSDPTVAVKSFFAPLQKGPKYINDATAQLPFAKDESRKYVEKEAKYAPGASSSFSTELNNIMVNNRQGKVTTYTLTNSLEKLNGNYVIQTYQVKFFGGQVREVEFKFLRPIINGDYQFVDATFLN